MKERIMAFIICCTITVLSLVGCGAETTPPATVPQMEEDTSTADESKNDEDEAAKKAEEERIAEENRIAEETAIIQLVADGIDYLHGTNGKEYDPEKALACFEEADEKGNSDATFLAGYVIDYVLHGGKDGDDYEKALTYYEKCETDNPYAKAAIAYLYKEGKGIDKDENKALSLFSDAISDIDTDALLNSAEIIYADEARSIVGEMYYNGDIGGEPDYTTAMEFFDIAAKTNNTVAYNDIGYMYLNGEGIEQDYDKALEYYQKSADLGDRIGIHQLGYMYQYGCGVDQDYSKSIEYYEKAAELGYARSYNQIGLMYYNGEGVAQDYSKAQEYFELAVQGNDGYGFNNLGMMYLYGDGVEQDYKKAAEYFEDGANRGHAGAMANLAYLYYEGLGVEQSNENAAEYFKKAATLGDTWAQDYCKKLGVDWSE